MTGWNYVGIHVLWAKNSAFLGFQCKKCWIPSGKNGKRAKISLSGKYFPSSRKAINCCHESDTVDVCAAPASVERSALGAGRLVAHKTLAAQVAGGSPPRTHHRRPFFAIYAWIYAQKQVGHVRLDFNTPLNVSLTDRKKSVTLPEPVAQYSNSNPKVVCPRNSATAIIYAVVRYTRCCCVCRSCAENAKLHWMRARYSRMLISTDQTCVDSMDDLSVAWEIDPWSVWDSIAYRWCLDVDG